MGALGDCAAYECTCVCVCVLVCALQCVHITLGHEQVQIVSERIIYYRLLLGPQAHPRFGVFQAV